MNKFLPLIAALLFSSQGLHGAVTLEQCQAAAEDNYPMIRQYDLIKRSSQLTVANVKKAWLPQITASAQASYQSDVAAWPDEMQAMLSQMGVNAKGINKDQYRLGIDLNQTVYDGGRIGNAALIARQQSKVETAAVEVNLYAVKERVNDIYFSALLLNEQLTIGRELASVFATNEQKLESLWKHDAAAQSEYYQVKAERLSAEQKVKELESQKNATLTILSLFCGIEVDGVVTPPDIASNTAGGNSRPELKLYEAQLQLEEAQERQIKSGILPKIGIFAQGYYGYPGYNMFEAMTSHQWTLNGMVGAKLTWDIGNLYTYKNDKAKSKLRRELIINNRDVFIFNNKLDQQRHSEDIERYRALLATDTEIIPLRTSVRRAAESKLNHGIIDVSELVREIHNEHSARQQQSIHQIELLQEIYRLRLTTNN